MAKRSKRRGEIGSIKMSAGPAGPSVEWEKIPLPEGKADLEQFYAEQFVAAFNRAPLLPGLLITEVRQNAENSLDFTLLTSLGQKWLELMEVAPFEFFGVPPDQAPNTHKPYDLAQWLHGKIMEKSRKYRSTRPGNLFLLLYLTDWRFLPSETAISLLQFWCNRKAHSFEAIFVYMPMTATEGHISLIAPTPSSFWKGFKPDMYRDNKTINLDPAKWQAVTGHTGPTDPN